jgi:hypothetical protein
VQRGSKGELARGREELAIAIAELDLRREQGELNEREWERSRAALKARLEEVARKEPAS